MTLKPEEYQEPACLLKMQQKNAPVRPVAIGRMMARLDEDLSRNDTEGALRHLHFWEAEAIDGADDRGLLAVANELMGLLRKLGRKEEAYHYAELAGELVEKLGLADHLTAATVYLNQGTVLEAFGESRKALEKYRQTKEIYERELEPQDLRLGGLYNNMGLACVAQEEFSEARTLFEQAISVMTARRACLPEAAISCLNMVDLLYAEKAPEEAEKEADPWLDQAEAYLFDAENPRDGNFAFVCEKCGPVLGFYGRFLAEARAKKESDGIYNR